MLTGVIYNFPIGFCLCLFNISGQLVRCSVSTDPTTGDAYPRTIRWMKTDVYIHVKLAVISVVMSVIIRRKVTTGPTARQ